MNKNPFFAITLVLIILGCITDTPTGPGIMIKEFRFTPDYLNGDQKTTLSLVVQNRGDKNVENAYATVYGFGEETMWTVTGDMTTQQFNLRAPSSFTNNVGEEKRFSWIMNSDDIIPKDAVRSYIANARVCYPYKTSVLARAEIISENEWMSNPPSQHQIDVTQTKGPVRISITSKQPVIMSSKLKLELLVENIGSGTVATQGYCAELYGGAPIDSTKLNRIDMEVSGISNNCVIEGDTGLFLEQGRRQKIVVSCEVSGIDAPITTADIEISFNYDYYLDARTTVRVVGPVSGGGTGGLVLPPEDSEEPPEEDELALPVPAEEGAILIDTVKVNGAELSADGSGTYTQAVSCTATATVNIFILEGSGDPIQYYPFALDLSSSEIKITHDGQTTTKPLGTVKLLETDDYGVRISHTASGGGCTFSTAIYST